MLENLRIQNFKSWQDTGDIRFGSLSACLTHCNRWAASIGRAVGLVPSYYGDATGLCLTWRPK